MEMPRIDSTQRLNSSRFQRTVPQIVSGLDHRIARATISDIDRNGRESQVIEAAALPGQGGAAPCDSAA
jgi:hypothetical protein